MSPSTSQERSPRTTSLLEGAAPAPTHERSDREPDQARENAKQPQPENRSAAALLIATQRFADEIADRPNLGNTSAPLDDLRQLSALGVLTATLPASHSGLGFGTEPGGHQSLLRLLSIVGGADLALGRLVEGHCNALILIAAFGTPAQLARAADDARAGLLFGVWNTGTRALLELRGTSEPYTFTGAKTFATGAAFVRRPIITATLEGCGWQMALPRMEAPEVAAHIRLDHSFWHPLGMESSESYGLDLTGATITQDDLIGEPEAFYRDPLFRGGAIRFAAVQAGAILRLHRLFAAWLESSGLGNDPYQVARLGEVALGAQEAVLWIERAGNVAEAALEPAAGKLATERMIECANQTRLAIERIATAMMPRIIAGVGARGLLQPHPFERLLRDLTMYLRQPAPDQTLADVGRASLRKSTLRAEGATHGLWLDSPSNAASLPPSYFDRVYQANQDPWNFETSDYEKKKYAVSLASLPREHYAAALEIGCSIGVLTAQLATRCGSLLSIDVSEQALASARERCASLAHVRFARMHFPEEAPEGSFDLIVVSEVAYYWQHGDLDRAAALLAAHQPAGGHLLLVHFTDFVPDYPLTGDEVHDAWLARSEWRSIGSERHDHFRLDLLERQG